jgi:hypothetical protein
MKGYKYRGIEFIGRDFETLIKNQIYAPPFILLNDPFEGLFNDEITRFVMLLEKLFKVKASEVLKNLEDIKNFKTQLGIYSLSKTYSEELLWAHYASAHKGFCIEYDISKLKEKYFGPVTVSEFEVAYNSIPPTITHEDIEKATLMEKLFATKSKKWEYEEEIRLIFDTYSEKDYHPSALTGIYFGTEFNREEKLKFIDSLKGLDVKFYDMYRENNSYKLKRQLFHENKREIQNKLAPNSFEILKKRHFPAVENFYVLYKSDRLDDNSIRYFFKAFRENFATKGCNIHLFDSKEIADLIAKIIEGEEYIKFADHCIAVSYFETPDEFSRYPFQDFLYKDYGGKNWKKEKIA